ncbi:MAG: hypothetical protein ABI680_10855 [Chthoniobacteraceae bacterium]
MLAPKVALKTLSPGGWFVSKGRPSGLHKLGKGKVETLAAGSAFEL